MECIYGMDELSVMGFTDVLPRILHDLSRSMTGSSSLMDERRPVSLHPGGPAGLQHAACPVRQGSRR
ncbi:MAG: hypothetical protein MZU95_14160 [Desulfomicrobium escambiense]|nr:hypothetical protein [Desulfomicrobium escambiense]